MGPRDPKTQINTDFIYDTNFFTQQLETFSCIAFLSAYESRQVNCRLSLADKMRVKFKEDLSNAEDAKGNK